MTRRRKSKTSSLKRSIRNATILFFVVYALWIDRTEVIRFFAERIYLIVIAIATAGIVIGALLFKRRLKIKKYNSLKTIEELREKYADCPTRFESFVAYQFEKKGYKAKVTPAVNDGGKDILLWKDNLKYVVEVKLYAPENKIGREKIQKLHSAMIDSRADAAFFVTTSDYTLNAIEYAKKYGIETINGEEFAKWIMA